MRRRILGIAVRLYRRFGHQKATVIDIAREISMSPANFYRFFGSKQAIKEAVVGKLFDEAILAAVGAAHSGASATHRLQAILQAIQRLHADRSVYDKRLHELVVTAMRENWTIVGPYTAQIETIVAEVIADGQGHGEFRYAEPPILARSVLAAMEAYTNPLLTSANRAEPTLGQMMEFCVGALRERRGSDDLYQVR